MTIFVSGGAKNGKSTFAQNLAVDLAKGGKRYYIATMIPSDEEDRERIRRHIADRDGLDFETIECGTNILSCLERADSSASFLLDSATALLMNELFPVSKNYAMDLDAASRCADDLVVFLKSVQNAIVVSDYIYSDAQHYDTVTETYRKCLAEIDRRLARECDTVIEVSAGQLVIHKGELPI